MVKPAPDGGRVAYVKERELRKTFTAADYISVLHSGNFGKASGGINRADYGIRPELYKDIKGIQLFAPANYLCYADKPDYLNYFQTADGLAVSNVVSYDEVGSRSINPKYEGNMLTPGGPAFSMALTTASLESFLANRKRVASPANADTPKALASTANECRCSFSMVVLTALLHSSYGQNKVVLAAPVIPFTQDRPRPKPGLSGNLQEH